jgi:hypothetical protein
METPTYRLPAHWAPALINGDTTGLEDEDESKLNAFIKGEGLQWPLDVGEEEFFCKYHDAQPYGVLACDCLDFIFIATNRQ